MNKLVSVIIPTYNMGNHILESIASLLNQTYKHIEIIVVDDGSTDNTEKLIKKLIKKQKNIRYIKQSKQTNSAARNKGIKKSKGDYIIFLDADDDLPVKSIEYRVNYLEKYQNIDCVYGNTAYIDKKNKIKYIKKSYRNIKPIDFLTFNATPFIPMTLMYKKNVFNKIGLFDTSIIRSQDADICYKSVKYLEIGYLNKTLYNYHKYSHKLFERVIINIKQLIGKYKVINKNTNKFTRIYLLVSNTLFFPIKLIHQFIFFNK